MHWPKTISFSGPHMKSRRHRAMDPDDRACFIESAAPGHQ